MNSRRLSAAGIRFLDHPFPAEDLTVLTGGLPAYQAGLQRAYYVPHRLSSEWVGCLLCPEALVS